MSRKGRVAKRDVLPDPVYNSKTISKLINNIMSVSYTHLDVYKRQVVRSQE